MKLTHRRVTEIDLYRIFDDIDTDSENGFFDQFVNAVKKHSTKIFPKDESDEENPYKEANKLKGDCFEIFGEFLIKYMGTDTRIDICEYSPELDEDLGVDGYGRSSANNMPATVQFKFKGNVTNSQLLLGDLRDFFGLSFERYGVPREHTENLLIITTARHFSHKIKRAHPKCRILGYDQLKFLTNKNKNFWIEIKKAVKNSAMDPKEREYNELYEHQVYARIANQDLIRSAIAHRGQNIVPTGGGKTTNERLAAEDCFMYGGQLVIVASPRIALTEQLFTEFYAQKTVPWDALIINSGDEILVDFFTGETKNVYRPTTNVTDIVNMIKSVLATGAKLIVFTTYHSLAKHKKNHGALRRALEQLELEHEVTPDLIVADEAHNLTRDDFSSILDMNIKKWLFFTATRKVSYSDAGFGMNNVEKFGTVIFQIAPRTLIERGMIVPPRLHFVHASEEILREFGGKDLKDSADLAMVIAGIRRHIEEVAKYADNSARIIVFCKSATQAHEFADSEVIRVLLPEIEHVAAVTSHSDKMVDTRKNIFTEYAAAKYSILFHYDVISEGIDLAGTTGVLILRSLREIKATQGIGRALRILLQDRNLLRSKKIKVGDPIGWNKPFGWVIIPYIDGASADTKSKIEDVIEEIRSREYDIDVETMVFSEKATGGKKTPPEFEETGDNTEENVCEVTESQIKSIIDSAEHTVEELDRALVQTEIERDDYGF